MAHNGLLGPCNDRMDARRSGIGEGHHFRAGTRGCLGHGQIILLICAGIQPGEGYIVPSAVLIVFGQKVA